MIEAPFRSRRRVLIIDDEPRMRDMLLRAVQELGFEALAARSAEQAGKLLTESPPAIILLDLNLPGMHGLEFLHEVHARNPQIQFVILTGFGSIDAAKVAIRHDVADFLTKPCPLEELERALARALARVPTALAERLTETQASDSEPNSPASLEDLERSHILAALERRNGNRALAAADLGISERTLYYRLARYQQQRG